MKLFKGLTIAVILLVVSGCGRVQPIHNVENTPVAYNLQISQVKQAIIESGTNRGWIMTETKPGTMRGEYSTRSHDAVIDVEYSNKTYSINYVSSKNLNYNDGEIHRNYNRWVNNLDVDIKKKLAMLAL